MSYFLGKLPKKQDSRNLLALSYLLPGVKVPKSFDYEKQVKGPYPTLDQCDVPACTVFSSASSQMRFEKKEQGKIIVPQFVDLVTFYNQFAQPGGGAFILDVLKAWRKDGLPFEQSKYCIDAFAEVAIEPDIIKQALYTFGLCEIGVQVTQHMMDVPDGGKIDLKGDQAILGGHAMCVDAYSSVGLRVVDTWAGFTKRRTMTWAYVRKYMDECYSLVDAKDAKVRELVDVERLLADLRQLVGEVI
ncbi:MAG: hypothetical protein M1343_08335 [Chloroflexi bacterium]|nr:hypothetical protein [Chloroflexota bacterium]